MLNTTAKAAAYRPGTKASYNYHNSSAKTIEKVLTL
jgi:hypothetical protein